MIKILTKYYFKQSISMVKIGPSQETIGPSLLRGGGQLAPLLKILDTALGYSHCEMAAKTSLHTSFIPWP